MGPLLLIAAGLLASGCAYSERERSETTAAPPDPKTILPNSKTAPDDSVKPPPPSPLDEEERPADAGRVRIFEGLTYEDFSRDIPEKPGKKDLLRALRMIITGGGDLRRVDPGDETFFVSTTIRKYGPQFLPFRIWPSLKDEKLYLEEFEKTDWERRRADIKVEFNLLKVNHHSFQAWFDAVEVSHCHFFRGLPSFDRLADVLLRKIPEISKNQTLNVLYPASGAHIAPLLTAMRLIERGEIRQAKFIYTEINANYFEDLRVLLGKALEKYVFEKVTYQAPILFPEGGVERTIELAYQGHPIQLVFSLNRSGSKYYREEYLKEANLVIIHDPGTNKPMQSFDLLAEILLDKKNEFPKKDQMVIMEGDPRFSMHKGWYGNLLLPSGLVQEKLAGPYGHCNGNSGVEEVKECAYENSRVFLLNNTALQGAISSHLDAISLSRALYKPSPSE
jgi:hypothetical protein